MKVIVTLSVRSVLIILFIAATSSAGIAEEARAANLIRFRIKDHFVAEFAEESGHRADLVNAQLFTIQDELVEKVVSIIGDKLLELERKSEGVSNRKLRSLIFGLDQYLFQMQGYKVEGEMRVYVNAVPLAKERNPFLSIGDEDISKRPPKHLILPDGGGMYFWQAYIIPEKKSIDLIFNNEF